MRLWKRTLLLMLITLFLSLFAVGGLTLYITGKSNIENVAESYGKQLFISKNMMEQFWDNAKYEQMTEVGKHSYLVFQFELCCGRGFALLENGIVVENMTGYEVVDIEAMEVEESKEESDYRIQELNGDYLLLQQVHLDVQQNFMLFSVQNISGNFEQLKRLSLWFAGIYCLIFLAAGAFLYYMMRRTMLRMERLQETAEQQELLLGALAHEMKTPMTSIIGFSDSLLHVKLQKEQQLRALEHINREGRRLESLSGKMLDLVGLYQNQAITLGEHSVDGLISNVVHIKEASAREKGVYLVTEWEEFTLWMDEELMESLLCNLVDNALRASQEGASIWIRARHEKHRKWIEVEDQGCGIPVSELKKVTEAFYMVDKSRSRRAGGVGLGLALCKKIADLHKAKFWIASEEGLGTIVTIEFGAE